MVLASIRVDLVFFIPILALATYWAHQSYLGRSGHQKVVGMGLGVIGLFVVSLFAEGHGYQTLAIVGFVVGILAIILYAFKSRPRTNRT